jgi:hypothetical protein
MALRRSRVRSPSSPPSTKRGLALRGPFHFGSGHALGTLVMAAALAGCTARRIPEPREEPSCVLTRASLTIPVGTQVMQPICDGVYAEPGMTEDEQRALKRAHQTARRELTRAFGTTKGEPPITLFCRSAACKVGFGATPASASANDLGFARDGLPTATGFLSYPTVVVTAPGEGTARILTHELVHAEMKAYVPYDSLPTWFNEGMATFIAREPNCEAFPPSSTFDVRRLDTKQAWQDHLRAPGVTLSTYCQARHEVSAWADSLGGPKQLAPALKAVLGRVADGGAFRLVP